MRCPLAASIVSWRSVKDASVTIPQWAQRDISIPFRASLEICALREAGSTKPILSPTMVVMRIFRFSLIWCPPRYLPSAGTAE